MLLFILKTEGNIIMNTTIPRKHAVLMTQYAMDENALVFVKIGEVNGYVYHVYVTTPLWADDAEYVVRNDMTVEEAIADARETFQLFNAERDAFNSEIEQVQLALELQKV